VSLEDDVFQRHAPAFAAGLTKRFVGRTAPVPRVAASLLRLAAQGAAERLNSHIRRATLESDRRLDSALAFTGRTE
jgi:hypothetical protein